MDQWATSGSGRQLLVQAFHHAPSTRHSCIPSFTLQHTNTNTHVSHRLNRSVHAADLLEHKMSGKGALSVVPVSSHVSAWTSSPGCFELVCGLSV